MATRPTKLPRWATVPSVDPVVGGDNVVEPPDQLKDDGWKRKQKPPGNYTNWLFNTIYLWLLYLDAGSVNYGVTTGTEPDYEVTIGGVESYFESLNIELRIHATNTDEATIDINGKGEVDLKRSDGTALQPGDLVIDRIYVFIHNGTHFVLPATAQDRGIAKAWVTFDGNGSITVKTEYSLTSVVRNSLGNYTITWNKSFSNAFWAASLTTAALIGNPDGRASIEIISQTANSIRIECVRGSDAAVADSPLVSVLAFGVLA